MTLTIDYKIDMYKIRMLDSALANLDMPLASKQLEWMHSRAQININKEFRSKIISREAK